MKTIETTTLKPSDLVVIDGNVYRADKRTEGFPCSDECHLYDKGSERCRGYCLRWDNDMEIVFRKIMPAWTLASSAEVCVTPMWRVYEERVARGIVSVPKVVEREALEGNKTKMSRGGVYFEARRGDYIAGIQHKGVYYRKRFKSEAEAEAWLVEKKEEIIKNN